MQARGIRCTHPSPGGDHIDGSQTNELQNSEEGDSFEGHRLQESHMTLTQQPTKHSRPQ